MYRFTAVPAVLLLRAALRAAGRFQRLEFGGPVRLNRVQNFLSVDVGPLTLNAAGTYTLLVEGLVNDTGTTNYSFNVLPVANTTQTLALGSVVSANLAAPGQQDRYTFNLTTNSLLYFDSLTNSDSIQWSLTGPGGAVISNRAFSGSDGFGVTNPVMTLTAGAYTLTVSALGQATGTYSFRLSDLRPSPPSRPRRSAASSAPLLAPVSTGSLPMPVIPTTSNP